MENSWIGIENIRFVRNRRLILEDITWRIEPGEHWVVLGANGSGKTTLLQILAGYLWPSSGDVTVLGERFGEVDLRTLRKKIGWVGSFLQAQVPPSQKPLEFIVSGKYASLGIFDKPEALDFQEAADLAASLHCENILDLPYAVLSQGEKQRLLIARALINKPRLLILDEPCGGLDLVSREKLLGTLEDLGRTPGGPSMVLVTHYLEEIMPVFSHVLLLKSGRCAAKGAKEQILKSDLLTDAFGIRIEAGHENGRYWSRIAKN
jgi:iron complex transport system ATP-binding protein